MSTAIPCKRPKVTVDPSPVYEGLFDHVCHVPGCGWTYRSVKSDHLGAPHHRRQHRDAVPAVAITRENGHPYRVACSCGHVRCDGATTTRIDAEGVRDFHLIDDHGLVSC